MKIISLAILVTFLFTTTVYPVSTTNTLRVPLGASKRARETIDTSRKSKALLLAHGKSRAEKILLTEAYRWSAKDFRTGHLRREMPRTIFVKENARYSNINGDKLRRIIEDLKKGN